MAVQDVMGSIPVNPATPDRVTSSRHAEEVVRLAYSELRQLRQQRVEIMKRIGTIKQTILGLAAIFDGLVTQDELLDLNGRKAQRHQTGLTKACRLVLMQAAGPLRAREVRDRLRRQGVLLEHHKDPLASVTTVLSRLVEYGEARFSEQPDGKRAFVWANQPV